MGTLSFVNFSPIFLKFTFEFLVVATFTSLVLSIYCHASKKNDTATSAYIYLMINYFLTLILVMHGLLFLGNLYMFMVLYESAMRCIPADITGLFKNFATCRLFGVRLSIDLYGFVLLLLAFFVGLFALLTSESKIKNINASFFFFFNYFVLIVYMFVATNNIFTMFICYELLLLPSFLYLLIISYTRKAMQASLYFVIWTQIGSLLVLVGIVYMSSIVGCTDAFHVRMQTFKTQEAYTIYCLLFIGFGFKIPIWPFHYWLTKTHVEAPSGFSIYLSGFLVKSALYAFFKISNLICFEVETVFFSTLAFVGSVDASLKMWGQSDLKKLVAYCTVQEMNLILLMFLVGDSTATICGIVFSAAHAFLSSLMFFLVDCIYRRFHTRSVYGLHGILQRTPNLAITIILMCVLYAGLPGTIKFSCEFYIFAVLAESSWLTCVILIFAMNVLGLIGFSKPWFNVLFGLPHSSMPETVIDLSRREIYVTGYTFFFYIFATYLALLSI